MRTLAWVLLWAGLPGAALAFDPFSRPLPEVEEGNQQYSEKHFDRALERFESAEGQLEREPRIHFNRGSTLFQLGRLKEAREAFQRALGTEDPELKKRNYYNIGNTFLAEKAFPDAVTFYRRALELDPAFDDARFNLELALAAMQAQKQNSGNQSNQDKQKDPSQDKQDQQDQQDSKKDPQQDPQQDPQSEQKPNDQQQDQKDQNDPSDQQQQDQQQKDQKQQDQQQQDQQQKDQQQKDQQQRDQQQQDQRDQQQEQQQQDPQQKDQQQQDKTDPQKQQKPGQRGQDQERQEPGKLSQAQVREMLDAMRENEKPFQMQRFMLPEFKRRDKKVEKDW